MPHPPSPVGFANNGISEKMGANNPITSMTTNFVSQLVGRATQTGGEMDWGAVSSAGSMDAMEMVTLAKGFYDQRAEAARQQDAMKYASEVGGVNTNVPLNDPYAQQEMLNNAAGYGLRKQVDTMNAIAASIQGMWDNGGREQVAVKASLDVLNSGGYAQLSKDEYNAIIQSVGVEQKPSYEINPYAIGMEEERKTIIATNEVANSIMNASQNGEVQQYKYTDKYLEGAYGKVAEYKQYNYHDQMDPKVVPNRSDYSNHYDTNGDLTPKDVPVIEGKTLA